MFRRPLALALASLVLLSLGGCGKAGRPAQPPDSVYPRIYPNPSAGMPTAVQQQEGRAMPPEWDQQDLKDRFTAGGSYIDPSTQVNPAQTQPTTNMLNTTTRTLGADPLTQGIGGQEQPSLLPTTQPTTSSTDEEETQQ